MSLKLDPRVVRSRDQVLASAASLLVEGGAEWVTVDRVVERSGVAKSTVYRHWPSRSVLVLDAFKHLLVMDGEAASRRSPGPGELRSGLAHLLGALASGLRHSRWAPVVPSLVEAAERDPEMRGLIRAFVVEIMGRGRALLHEAMERGELPHSTDIEVAIDLLVGPLFYRRLVSGEPVDEAYVARLLDHALPALGQSGIRHSNN